LGGGLGIEIELPANPQGEIRFEMLVVLAPILATTRGTQEGGARDNRRQLVCSAPDRG
jgi:hypothetical protein